VHSFAAVGVSLLFILRDALDTLKVMSTRAYGDESAFTVLTLFEDISAQKKLRLAHFPSQPLYARSQPNTTWPFVTLNDFSSVRMIFAAFKLFVCQYYPSGFKEDPAWKSTPSRSLDGLKNLACTDEGLGLP
jgi:hypothetical protein